MENKPIKYTEHTELKEDSLYINDGIVFTYKKADDNKNYILENGIRLNHIPTLDDKKSLNLKPISVNPNVTEEERKAVCSKGGKRSAEVQQKRRSFKDSINLFLSVGASKSQLSNVDSSILAKLPQEIIETLTQEDLIVLKALELAQMGSDKHQVFLRDTVGEKPTDKTEVTADIMTDGDRALLEKVSKRLNK